MFPRSRDIYSRHNQRGSMLVISLFVIVVMALLALTLTRLLSASSDTLIFEVYGLRAHQAAQSGLEVKLTEVFPLCPPGSANPVCADGSGHDPSACDLNSQVSFSLNGMLHCGFNTSCSYSDSGSNSYYLFTSTGTCEAGDAVVSRTLSVDTGVLE